MEELSLALPLLSAELLELGDDDHTQGRWRHDADRHLAVNALSLCSPAGAPQMSSGVVSPSPRQGTGTSLSTPLATSPSAERLSILSPTENAAWMAAARAAGWLPPPTHSGTAPPSPPGSPGGSQPPTPPPPARSRSLKRQDSKGPTETAFSRAANAEAAEHAHELRENEPSSPFHKAADAPGALAAATAALKAAQPRPGLLVRAASNLHHVKEAVHVEAPVEDLDEVTLLIIPTLLPQPSPLNPGLLTLTY